MSKKIFEIDLGKKYFFSSKSKIIQEVVKSDNEQDDKNSIKICVQSSPLKSSDNDCEDATEGDEALEPLLRFNAINSIGRDDAPYCLKRGPWDDTSTILLIKLLSKYPSAYFYLGKETNRIAYWEIIRQKLEEQGYKFSLYQVRMHWRSLMKVYKSTVNSNELNDTNNECQYYKEMTECLGSWDRHSTLILIDQVVAYNKGVINQSGCMKLRMKAWITIAKRMKDQQKLNYQPYQLQARWRNLIQLYQMAVRHNAKSEEKIYTAYHEELQNVYEYVPFLSLKVDIEGDVAVLRPFKTFTMEQERMFLNIYQQHMHKFLEKKKSTYQVWTEIHELFLKQTGLKLSLQKLRNCFYELKRRLCQVKQHNSHPGAIHKVARHADLLEEIYSKYNCWPHNGTKMNLISKAKNRQFYSQMMWTEEETNSLLEIYPDALLNHQCSGETIPYIKLTDDLSQKLVDNGFQKRPPLEIEIFLQQLRRGYEKRNLHPFNEIFQKIIALEQELGFKPPVSDIKLTEGNNEECKSRPFLQYWGQEATHLLLQHIKEQYLQNKEDLSFIEIKRKLATHNYDYSGMDCREYFSLLKKIYQSGIRCLRNKRKIMRPFLYAKNMQEVFQAMKSNTFKKPLEFEEDKPIKKRIKLEEELSDEEIEWTEAADQTLLMAVKSQIDCHNWMELICLMEDSFFWDSVRTTLEEVSIDVDASSCISRYTELMKEYKKASYSSLLLQNNDSPYIELMEEIVSVFTIHDIEAEERDFIVGTREIYLDETEDEILELLFIIAELNSVENLFTNEKLWHEVSSMMAASDYKAASPHRYYTLFNKLQTNYFLFWQRNLYCKRMNKERPPFYFKMHKLFGKPVESSFISKIVRFVPIDTIPMKVTFDCGVDNLLLKWLSKERGFKFHPVPRIKVLQKLASLYARNFDVIPEIHEIWARLVHIHSSLQNCKEEEWNELINATLVEDVWTNHESPFIAFNFQAIDLLLWQKICLWSEESVKLFLTECACLAAETSSVNPIHENSFIEVFTSRLQQHSLKVTEQEVHLIINHFIQAFLHGGYTEYKNYLSLILVLQPSLSIADKTLLKSCSVSDSEIQIGTKRPSAVVSSIKSSVSKYAKLCHRENKYFKNIMDEMHKEEMELLKEVSQLFTCISP